MELWNRFTDELPDLGGGGLSRVERVQLKFSLSRWDIKVHEFSRVISSFAWIYLKSLGERTEKTGNARRKHHVVSVKRITCVTQRTSIPEPVTVPDSFSPYLLRSFNTFCATFDYRLPAFNRILKTYFTKYILQ